MGILDGLFGKPKETNKDAEIAARAKALREAGIASDQFIAGGAPIYNQGQQYTFNELGQLEQLGPSEMQNIQTDPRLMQAQYDALRELETRGREGFTARDELDRLKTKQQVGKENAGRLGAIQQNMAARGMGGSGLDLVAQLAASQAATEREALAGLERNAAQEANRANSSAQAGSLAGNIRGQGFQENSAKAQAQDLINRFNTQNSINRSIYNNQGGNRANEQNVNRSNQVSDMNTQGQYGFRKDALGVRQGQQQMNYNAATEDLNAKRIRDQQARAAKQAQIQGITTLAGAGLGAAMAGPGGGMAGAKLGGQLGYAGSGAFMAHGGMVKDKNCYASGGMIPGEEVVPWDDTANDVVQINASPGEIVIPKSIANDPLASAQFVDQENRKAMNQARSKQDMYGLGNILGKAATDYGNAQNPDVILANRMQDLGQAPSMYKSEKKQFDSSVFDNMGKQGVDRASEDAARNEKAFARDVGLRQAAEEKDPNNQKAQQANLILKSVLANKAKEAEMAGDKATASQIRSQIQSMQPMAAKDAMFQMEGIKNLDYKDILSSMAAQRTAENNLRLEGMKLAGEQGKEAKKDEQYKTGLTLDLQKQVAGDQVVKDAAQVNKTLAQVEQGLNSRTQTAFDDQKLIVSFNKALDPGSVVKESEFALTAAGASLIERAKQAAEQYKTGTRLSPEMRQQLIQTMRDLRDGYNNYLQGHLTKYQNTANKLGLDQSLVFGDQPFMRAQSGQIKQGQDLLNGTKSPGQPAQAPKSDWRNHK